MDSDFPSIALGVVPRERFALTGEVLRRIIRFTSQSYRLIVVDCAMPQRYRQEVETILGDKPHAKILHFDRYLLPNESRNRVIEATDEEYVCLIDNDVLVEPEWLTPLMDALKDPSVGMARPYVVEGFWPHFDPTLGHVEVKAGIPTQRVCITRPTRREEYDPKGGRRPVEWLEMHCLLFRRSVFDQIGPLDPGLNTREHVDLALSLRAAGIPRVFEPASRVRFVPPPPVQPDERDFFFFRWDLQKAVASHARIKSRWNLVQHRENFRWLRERHCRTSHIRHWLRQAFRPFARLLELGHNVSRFWEQGSGQLRDYLVRRRFRHLVGVQAPTFKIEIQETNTRFLEAGAITFSIEPRLSPATDPGISIHVFAGKPDGKLIERLRFDCLHDKPHYHYVFHNQGLSQKFWIDPLMVPDPKAWSLQRIRHNLQEMFNALGGDELATLVDQDEIEHIFPELEEAVQRADALTRDSFL